MSSYSGENIPTKGKVKLNCKIGKVVRAIEFQVYDGLAAPILGLTAACELNLIKRNRIEDAKVSMINGVNKGKYLMKYKDVFEGVRKIKDFEYKRRISWQNRTLQRCSF